MNEQNNPNNQNSTGGFHTYTPEGQPYYNQDNMNQPAVQSNGLSTASLVLGIFSLVGHFCCCSCLTPLTAILAIIFSLCGRVNGRFAKYGKAGLITGIIALVLIVVLIVVYVAFIAWLAANPEYARQLEEILNQYASMQ